MTYTKQRRSSDQRHGSRATRCAESSAGRDRGVGATGVAALFRALAVSCVAFACAQQESTPSAVKDSSDEKDSAGLTFPQGGLVAHAMGAVDNRAYTNSEAAFHRNYAAGRRWFEVDFSLTRDGKLFAFHEGHEKHIGAEEPIQRVDSDHLRDAKYLGVYPLLRVEQVLELFAARKDAYLVTDTKRWTPELAEAFASHVAARLDVATRIVPQLYRTEDFEVVTGAAQDAGFDYPAFIFTLYQNRLTDDEVVAFVEGRRIPVVVVHTSRFSPWTAESFHAAGAKVLVHTVNRHEDVQEFGLAGADGFYTDYYLPYTAAVTSARSAPIGAEALASPRWSKFALSHQGDFRLSKCVRKQGPAWFASGCGAASVLDGPRRPAPKGASVKSRAVISAKVPGLQARLRVASRGGRKEHYGSGWEAVPVEEKLTLESEVTMTESVADIKLQLYVREPSQSGAVGSGQARVADTSLIVEDASLEISADSLRNSGR